MYENEGRTTLTILPAGIWFPMLLACHHFGSCPEKRSVVHCVYVLSYVLLFAVPWTVAHQAPLSMEFSRWAYWSGFPCLQGIFPTQGSRLRLLCLMHWQADSLPLTLLGRSLIAIGHTMFLFVCMLISFLRTLKCKHCWQKLYLLCQLL